ncbi:MAG: formylglycine-generating enzyme family protein [Bacteroidota bacterium]|nr:formylglycine-generating enzyme family protein [Bacteroidota bacterium]
MSKVVKLSVIFILIFTLFSCKGGKDMTDYAAMDSDNKVEDHFVGEDYTERILGVEFEMIAIEGGVYYMGSDDADANDDENPLHKVRLDNFYLCKYEVTQFQWEAIIGDNPSYNKGCDDCPVENIMFRVEEFIDALNQVTGKNYRLPTEAEWEYAARGGQDMPSLDNRIDFTFSESNQIDEVAWCADNSRGKTHPVGLKKSNALGIYDMTGNVWEPCQDKYYADYYNFSVPNNPVNPAMGDYQVLRGGSWFNDSYNCRNTNRVEGFRNYGSNTRGIRLAHDL